MPVPSCPVTYTCVLAAAVAAGTAPPARAQCLEGCHAIYTLLGQAPGDQFGWEANAIGDVDGDGVSDFVTMAPTNDAGGTNAGRIYVHSGAGGQQLWQATGLAGGQLGFVGAGAGDINGDLIPDVIAGAPGSGAGRAIVYSGQDGSVIHQFFGQVASDRFGFRVAGGGDANGDGHADLLVSADWHDAAGTNSGRLYVYDGSDFSLLCTADGEAAGHQLGSSTAFVGDLDGDGRDEFIVGAQNAGPSGGGRAYLYTFDGASCVQLHAFNPQPGGIDFGLFFADGGRDVDNDGIPDFYVGDFAANRAYVYSGADLGAPGWAPLYVLSGDNNGQFGLGEMIDDVNGDGHADLILAAWISNAGAPQAGKVFVYSGADGTVLNTFTHDIPGATFGFDAGGIGDVNGDKRADYLITAAWDLGMRGRTYVISGSLGVPGDIDGDGLVGVVDFLLLLGSWGPCPDCSPSWECPADLDHSCTVDVVDFLMLLASWT